MATRKPRDNDAADRQLGAAIRKVMQTMKGTNERKDLAADKGLKKAVTSDIRRDKREVGGRKPKGRK